MPWRPRERKATRLLLKVAMQATRRAPLSAGDLITAGGSC